MSNKISKILVTEVHKEAILLKKFATSEELGRLSFRKLEPKDVDQCIYGLTCGNCANERAQELLDKCAVAMGMELEADCKIKPIKGQSAAERIAGVHPAIYYFSAIEVYIAQDGADTRQLIRFLKGKVDTLDLTPTINC